MNAMDFTTVKPYEDQAIDMVVYIINAAKSALGERLNLVQLAKSRELLTGQYKVSLARLVPPYSTSTIPFLTYTIAMQWRLTPTLSFVLRYLKCTKEETAICYYFEAIFSQPTASYPVPQTTASVFFRLEDSFTQPVHLRGTPTMHFWLEGSRTSHDIRLVNLSVDWILAIMQMKVKLYKRVEEICAF